jgi:hypothetical protein
MEEAVSLRWFNLDFEPGDSIALVTEKLKEKRLLDLQALPQSVYVIRLAGNFAIEYPGGLSPVVYIGQGKFRGRLNAHRKWLEKLHNLIAQSPLQVRFCMPRSGNGVPLHKELESHLLRTFEEKYLQRPLDKMENRVLYLFKRVKYF